MSTFQNTFAGKNILITGGGRGVGKALIKRFVEASASVFTLEKDPQLAENLRKEFPNVRVEIGDISKWKETRELIESFGVAMDHLVNNAAVARMGPFLDVTEEDFDLTINVNLKGLFSVTQAVAKRMIRERKKGCTIVNISSLAGVIASCPLLSTYSAAKAGVIMLTKSLAVELSQYGIRVNAISPTAIKTPMYLETVDDRPKDSAIYRTPLNGRDLALEPDEIVDCVIFLLSSQSGMTTGHNLMVDGGITVC